MAARGLHCGADGIGKLPKIRCPRGGTTTQEGGSPRTRPLQQRSPRTPRRRDGRLSAGAAFSLFFRSPVSSPRAGRGGAPMAQWGTPGGCPLQPSNHQPAFDPTIASSHAHLPWMMPPPTGQYSTKQLSSALASLCLASPSTYPSPSLARDSTRALCLRHGVSGIATHTALSEAPAGLALSPRRGASKPGLQGSGTRVCAWGRGSDSKSSASASARDPRREASESANEDLLLFFYQLDLNMRLQRALNQDQYEPAQQLREKITEVEREISRLRDAKLGGVSAKEDAQDKGITLLSLKAELTRAIEEEEYELAAELRNKIAKLESDTLAASAAALATKSREYQFRLGQRVLHKAWGYQGLIAGMDPACCESVEWRKAAGLEPAALSRPFYQVLVDVKEGLGFPVAYVSEDSLAELEEPTKDRFDHPYVYLLFYGMDARGDFIPCQQLREKYNAPRHEIPEDDQEEGE